MGVTLKEIRRITPTSAGKRRFLRSLARDIGSIGASARVSLKGRRIQFCAKLPGLTINQAILHLHAVRQRRLQGEAEFIYRMERKGIGELFGDGIRVQPDRIQPSISICRTEKELEVFHYCRLVQSFPTSNLLGRQIRALVYDVGQGKPFLMGALGLCSSPYTLRCRDEYLGWHLDGRCELKAKGLNCLMQLAICMSFPPYSYLLGGKLIASLALADKICRHFTHSYQDKLPLGGQLMGLVTICAGGRHCPIFNRIMLRPGGLYRHIGETAGYTTAYFSEETMNWARQLGRDPMPGRNARGFGKSLRVIQRALRSCNLPYEDIVRNGLKKGVYMGFASPEALACLRSGKFKRKLPLLRENVAIDHWRRRLLPTRTARSDVVATIERFKGESLLLTRTLA